jgi:hypothetical protein
MMRAKRAAKAKRKWGWRDYGVTILCLLGSLFFFMLFWVDLNQTLSRLYGESVGTVTWKSKIVQQRFANRVFWARLLQGSPVYNGDFVRTAKQSETTILFPERVSMNLEENSLVQIFSGNGPSSQDAVPRIVFLRGSMSVNSSGAASQEGISVMLGAQEQRIRVAKGAVLDARLDLDGIFTLRLSEGRVDFDRNGVLQTLTGGDTLSIDTRGNLLMEALTVMRTPRPAARMLGGETPLPVDFVWTGVYYADGERTRLEIAEDRGFKRIVHTRNGGADDQVRVEMTPGVWFWRAYPVSRDGMRTGVGNAALGRLSVSAVPVPQGQHPKEGDAFRYWGQLPDIRFQWTSSPEIAYYVLEAADTPGFANPSLQTTVRGSYGETASLTVSSLAPGRWYWRVRPILGDEFQGTLAPSTPASFTITGSGVLAAPTLRSPPAETAFNIAEGRRDMYFSWQRETEAASYTLLISRSPDLQDPLLTRQVTTNYYIYPAAERALPEGRYYWGVYQTGTNGTISSISPSRPFTSTVGELVLQPLFPPNNYTTSESGVPQFTWRTNLDYPLRFQVSDTPNFSRLMIDEPAVGGWFPGPSLNPGRWYWRVTAGTENMQTTIRSFQVTQPLPPPVVTQTPPPPAPAPRPAPAPVPRPVPVPAPRPVPAPVPRQVHPVSLDYPPAGTEYQGLLALREPDSIRWSSQESAENVRFILSRNPDPLRGDALMDVRNPPAAIPLIALGEGVYYWTIQAETGDGMNISAPAPAFFRVLPAPRLPAAGGRHPENGYRIGVDQLWEMESLSFSWDAVPEANTYDLTLYREENGGLQLIRRWERLTQTSLPLDLSLLGNGGAFIWRVEALSRAADGSIERRGTIGENRFTLDLSTSPRQ